MAYAECLASKARYLTNLNLSRPTQLKDDMDESCPMKLFPDDKQVGVFRGFREGGLEFHADIALPYHSDMHHRPMHGSFILVRLENEDEAALGRIASFSSDGKLSSGSGEDFSIRAMQEQRAVPE